MARQPLDKERKLPWEVLALLGPTVTGAVFFSRPEAMKLIEEVEALRENRRGFLGQGSSSLAFRVETPKGDFAVKWVPRYDLGDTAQVAAFSRWKDWYARRGLEDPAPFLAPTQAVAGVRDTGAGARRGWWVIQPVMEHPSLLSETDPKRVRGVPREVRPGEFEWSRSPLTEEVLDIGKQIKEHPILGKRDVSGAPRFVMADVAPSEPWQNVGINPETKRAQLYDLGTLLNTEVRPYELERRAGAGRAAGEGFVPRRPQAGAYPLKQRRLPPTFKKGAGGGAAGLGISLLLGALGALMKE